MNKVTIDGVAYRLEHDSHGYYIGVNDDAIVRSDDYMNRADAEVWFYDFLDRGRGIRHEGRIKQFLGHLRDRQR